MPPWSPDGRSIVFSRQYTEMEMPELWIVGADGTGQRLLAQGGLSPHWSPDGRTIAFSGLGGIEVISSDGTGRRAIAVAEEGHSWSPGGNELVFTRGADVWTMHAHGSAQRRLIRSTAEDVAADWSPDGRWILFTTDRAGSKDVWVMRPDGSAQRRLTTHPADESAKRAGSRSCGSSPDASGGQRAEVVDRGSEERVLEIEESGPQGRAVGCGVEIRRCREPFERADEYGELEVDGGHAVGARAHACPVEHVTPLDELPRSRPAVPRPALGPLRLELEQVPRERLLETGDRRLDPVCRAPERRLASARGRRYGVSPPPALEEAAKGERRRLTRAELRDEPCRGKLARRVPLDHRIPAHSNLDDDGQNHGSAARPVIDDLTDGVVDVLLEELDLGDMSRCELTHHTIGLVAQFVQ
jgi:hypothetical protein